MNPSRLLSIVVVVAIFAFAFAYFPDMPQRMASHWNAAGVADGFSGRFVGLFLIPFISLAVFLLLVFIPRIDPYRENVRKFQSTFDLFILVFVLFFAYLEGLIVFANLGHPIDMVAGLIPPFAVLFLALAYLLRKSRRNFFIGIRTPWTLTSDRAWEKTHKLGSILFAIAAVLSLGGLLFRKYAIFFILVPILAVAIIAVVYSYVVREAVKKAR